MGAKAAMRTLVKAAAATAPAPDGTVVLIYHRVGPGGGEVTLPKATFAEQMAELADGGGLGTLDDLLEPDGRRPRVVVTFDDGTADIAEHALPILVEHRAPMLLYVATAFVEEKREFPGGGTPVSWAALRDCVATGLVTIGSHTHTHALLDRAAPAVVVDELERSSRLIEDRLGISPTHFAYPKAVPGSSAADREVRQRFRTAALAGTRPNRPGRTDLHRLARSPIQRSDGMRYFRQKVAGRMRLEDDLRRAANRVRYLRATT